MHLTELSLRSLQLHFFGGFVQKFLHLPMAPHAGGTSKPKRDLFDLTKAFGKADELESYMKQKHL